MNKKENSKLEIIQADFTSVLSDIKNKILNAQYAALKTVNKELISLYTQIGKILSERCNEGGWGNSVVEKLAGELQKEFPQASGYSSFNLWRMKKFYERYKDNSKLAPLAQEIAWSHNVIIMEKCKNDLEREFYLKMCKKFGWSKNVLINQIDAKSYEKFLVNQTNFDTTLPAKYKTQAKLAVKDEFSFDFLDMGDKHSEKQLELALISNIRAFLLEVGKDFAFIGNQYKLRVAGEDFFIDLLLYHRTLKCLVAFELKIGKFVVEYAGKMEFYLRQLDLQVRLPEENPSIGIIVCREKNRVLVEYAIKDKSNPIGVATYNISSDLPKDLQKLLPSAEEICKKLDDIL